MKYKYICRLCKSFLNKKHPGVYDKYAECMCNDGVCQFNTYIEQFNEKDRLDKMYEFWNSPPYKEPGVTNLNKFNLK